MDEQDWTDPLFVEGAVWAQIEDLTPTEQDEVLTRILNKVREDRWR